MEYRVEQKYIVNEYTIAYLQANLIQYMDYDRYSGEQGYLIKSIYFDDLSDSCLYENLGGYDKRRKYRIRAYNNDSFVIHLEKKEKYRGYTKKTSEAVSLTACLEYMETGHRIPDSDMGFIQKNLFAEWMCSRMEPKCIIEYERQALVDEIGNVRITFDKNIDVIEDVKSFFSVNGYSIPVMEKGMHILEVKYDELLPDYVKKILKECNLNQTAFSKYCYGRLALGQLK